MSNPNMFPPFWRKFTDKVLHFAAGFVIYIFAWGMLNRWLLGSPWAIVWALAVVGIIGFLKEVYDMVQSLNPSRFEWLDIAATQAGGIFAAIAIPILQRLN